MSTIGENALDELVAAVVESDDAVLRERACRALAMLLAADDDDATARSRPVR